MQVVVAEANKIKLGEVRSIEVDQGSFHLFRNPKGLALNLKVGAAQAGLRGAESVASEFIILTYQSTWILSFSHLHVPCPGKSAMRVRHKPSVPSLWTLGKKPAFKRCF
jgi:hypothetical protein